jgi:hypothetical protein
MLRAQHCSLHLSCLIAHQEKVMLAKVGALLAMVGRLGLSKV